MSDSFPFEWIKKKWREGFHVTAMATAGPQWAVVMSRNAGFQAQCVELDFQYSSEGIHRRWDEGAPRSIGRVNPLRSTLNPLVHNRDLSEGTQSYCWRHIDAQTAACCSSRRATLVIGIDNAGVAHALLSCAGALILMASRRLPHNVLRGDGGPVGVHPQHPAPAAGGRGAGDAAYLQLPLPPRQGEGGRQNPGLIIT